MKQTATDQAELADGIDQRGDLDGGAGQREPRPVQGQRVQHHRRGDDRHDDHHCQRDPLSLAGLIGQVLADEARRNALALVRHRRRPRRCVELGVCRPREGRHHRAAAPAAIQVLENGRRRATGEQPVDILDESVLVALHVRQHIR